MFRRNSVCHLHWPGQLEECRALELACQQIYETDQANRLTYISFVVDMGPITKGMVRHGSNIEKDDTHIIEK